MHRQIHHSAVPLRDQVSERFRQPDPIFWGQLLGKSALNLAGGTGILPAFCGLSHVPKGLTLWGGQT